MGKWRMSYKKTSLMILCIICFFVPMIKPAYADSQEAISVAIPMKQIFNITGGNLSPSDIFNYELVADDSSNPLPGGAGNGIYTFSMKGNEEITLDINYSSVGIYKYCIRQKLDKRCANYTYDEQIYKIEVYIKNLNDFKYKAQIIIKNENNDKPARVVYTNGYEIKKSNLINTGDNLNIRLYIIVLIIALLLFTVGMTYRKKQKKSDKNLK